MNVIKNSTVMRVPDYGSDYGSECAHCVCPIICVLLKTKINCVIRSD